MKTTLLLSLGMVLLSITQTLANGSPLSGNYVATQSACPYLVAISGNHPGSVINIVAGAQSFDVNLKYVCGQGDVVCQPGQVALQTLTSENVGHFQSEGEGGNVLFDGVYSNNGYDFLATITDLGLPDQQGNGAKPEPQLEAAKINGGVRLVFDGNTVCDLAQARSAY